jgi:hypothetical protein
MDNFDLRKYLIENRVTKNSKLLTENEISEVRAPRSRNEYVKVAVGSRGEVEEVEEVKIEQSLKQYLETVKEEIRNEIEDEDGDEYFDEFVSYDVNEKGTLGHISRNEEEVDYYISRAAFPEETDQLLYESEDDGTVLEIIENLFEGGESDEDGDY